MCDHKIKPKSSKMNDGYVQGKPQGWESRLSQVEVECSLHYSIVEGTYAAIMGTLTGGAFLTGFALGVGAEDFEIGLLASIPALMTLAQIPASYMVERTGHPRRIVLQSAVAGRLIWFIIALLPFSLFSFGERYVITVLLALIAASNLFGSITRLSWLSWMSALVPTGRMGKFFARRNLINNGIAMLAGMGAGQFLDLFRKEIPRASIFGFSVLFAVAAAVGMVSVRYLAKMAEPPIFSAPAKESYLKILRLPLREKNFRRLIAFSVTWNFSTNFAAPFFAVYMIQEAGLSYFFIGSLATIGGVISMFSMKYWGELSDRYGNEPILRISLMGKCIYPFLWVLTTPNSYLLYIIINMTSIFDAGLGLSTSNMLLKLAPKERNSVYLAVHGTLVGLSSTIGPIFGGMLASVLKGTRISMGFITLEHFKFMFLISGIFRIFVLSIARRLNEPQASSVSDIFDAIRERREPTLPEGFQQMIQILIVEPVRFIGEKVGSLLNKDENNN